MNASSPKANQRRYDIMIGCGGIGSGMFFALDGNATLGREESRGGVILDRRDYCKLHIISHYVKRLCEPELRVLPVGAVGDDDAGDRLLREMQNVGLDLRFVQQIRSAATLFSFCYLYPDGAGGNMTITDSASGRIRPEALNDAESLVEAHAGRGIALAVPEAPMDIRRRLLEMATRHAWYRVGSFTSGEIPTAVKDGWLDLLDLLAINIDEAAAFAGCNGSATSPADNVTAAVEVIAARHPHLTLSITAGRHGSWCRHGNQLKHYPVFPVAVEGTAGAGDAHLAGVLCGLIGGATPLEAHPLGVLTASMAVTSPHTIHPDLDRTTVIQFARDHGFMDHIATLSIAG